MATPSGTRGPLQPGRRLKILTAHAEERPSDQAATCQLFRNGRIQAVRIPAEFELPGVKPSCTATGAAGDRDGSQAWAAGSSQIDEADRREFSRHRRSCAAAACALTRYLRDTNIISDLIRNPQGNAAKRIAKRGEDRICTSIIVAAELRYGCAKSGSARLSKAVEDLLAEIDVLPFDAPADAEYGGIRAELEAAGKPIGGNDLLIAAQTRAAGPSS